MPTIADIRKQYPQYDDMSDADLAGALHKKYYGDMPRAEFDTKIGMGAPAEAEAPAEDQRPFMEKLTSFAKNVYNNPPPTVAGIRDIVKGARGASMELVNPASPESAEQAAGTMLGAAALGTPASPALRAGEGIMGVPIARQATPGVMPTPVPPVAPPRLTSADLSKSATENYNRAFNVRAIEIDAPVMRDIYNEALSKTAEKYDQTHEAPVVSQILREATRRVAEPVADPLQAMTGVQRGTAAPMTGKEIERIQKRLVAVKSDPTEAKAAREARAMIDEALGKLSQEAMINGDAAAFRDAIKAGRGDTAAKYRMRAMENAEKRGNLNDNAEGSFKSLIRPPLRGQPTPAAEMGFNPAEEAAIESVAKPSGMASALESVGRLSPSDPKEAAYHAAAAGLTHGLSVGGTLGAYGARKAADAMLQQRINNAMRLVAQRSPEYQRRAAAHAQAMAQYRRDQTAMLAQAQARQRAQRQALMQRITPTLPSAAAIPLLPRPEQQ